MSGINIQNTVHVIHHGCTLITVAEGVRSSGYRDTVLSVSRCIFVGACCLDVRHGKSGEFNSYILPP